MSCSPAVRAEKNPAQPSESRAALQARVACGVRARYFVLARPAVGENPNVSAQRGAVGSLQALSSRWMALIVTMMRRRTLACLATGTASSMRSANGEDSLVSLTGSASAACSSARAS